MATYVDNMQAPFGRMKMCHLWADTRDELFAMVDKIGVARKWFQRPDSVPVQGMKASWEHFDISMTKRALAVAAGAIQTDRYGPLAHTAKLDIMIGDLDRVRRGLRWSEAVGKARSRGIDD